MFLIIIIIRALELLKLHHGKQKQCAPLSFSFVTYSDPNVLERVLANSPHNLDGRTIDPKACNPRSMQKSKKATFGYPTPASIPSQRSFPAKVSSLKRKLSSFIL